MSAPKDYVLVPLEADNADVEVEGASIPISLADIDEGIVVVGTPKDMLPHERAEIGKRIAEAQAEKPAENRRTFIIVDGEIGESWKFWRLVPRENYDDTFDEEVRS